MSFPLKLILRIILYLLALIGAYHLLTGDFRPFNYSVDTKKVMNGEAAVFDLGNLKNFLKEKFQSLFDGAKKKTEQMGTEKMKETASETYTSILVKTRDFFKKYNEKEKASGSPSDQLRASLSEEAAKNSVSSGKKGF